MHADPHPHAGKTVKLKNGLEYRLEDWWDRLGQGSWQDGDGNMACIQYGLRCMSTRVPIDNEVVYGKIGSFGHIFHESELDL